MSKKDKKIKKQEDKDLKKSSGGQGGLVGPGTESPIFAGPGGKRPGYVGPGGDLGSHSK